MESGEVVEMPEIAEGAEMPRISEIAERGNARNNRMQKC